MKPRVAFLALPCLVLSGLFYVAGPAPDDTSTKVEAASVHTPDPAASRGAPRTAAELPMTAEDQSIETTTTTAPPPTTTTTAAPPVTSPPTTSAPPTTAKPKPKPTTTAAPKPKAAAAPVAHGDWMALIKQYPWDANHAYRIMMCESGGNPNARNKSSTATGLFQILGGPTDPAANVALAYKMYSTRGWQPWVCRG